MAKSLLKKVFNQKTYKTEELLYLLSQVMASSLTFKVLTQNVLEILHEKLDIAKVGIIVTDNKGITLREVAPGWQMPFNSLEEKSISKVVELRTNRRLVGHLILSGKPDGDNFSVQDVKTLNILAPEFAVAIENSLSYEEIRQFNETLQIGIKNATEELRKANERLLELDKLKDEFISIASHDLRTPISTVKNFLWLTINKETQLAPKVRDHLQRAYNAADRTAILITDMLDVSRIEGRRLAVKMQPVELVKLFDEIKDDVSAAAETKSITFSIDCPEGLKIVADPERLLQVINNLADNAVKFTLPGGKVAITTTTDGTKVKIAVSDTGMGIDKKDFPKLYTKFGRLNYTLSTIPEIPGTGLGLYISKKMLDLMNATIEVASEVGKGTTFTVTLSKA